MTAAIRIKVPLNGIGISVLGTPRHLAPPCAKLRASIARIALSSLLSGTVCELRSLTDGQPFT